MVIEERKGMAKVNDFLTRVKYVTKSGKPKLILRIIKSYWNIKVHHKIPPKYIDFAFDYTCNLNCKGCFAKAFSKDNRNRSQMSLEDYKRVIKEARALGCIDFNFQGGEPLLPLLLPKLEQLIKFTNPEENLVAITTNGTYLNEENVKKLKKWRLDMVVVSLDSGIAEEHDKYRGVQGTWEKATKGIDIALKNGLRVAVNTILTHEYLHSDSFMKLIEFCEKRKIVVNTLLPVPIGSWENNPNIILSDDDLDYLNELRKKHLIMRRDEDSTLTKWGCPAGKEEFHINAYGDVIPCAFLHITFGNVLKEPLAVIHERMMKFDYFSPNSWRECLLADRNFMNKYIKSIKENKEKPIDYSKVDWLND
jgi:MoaA/NifB/PqqE/SkfB family radical SAM enzyme